MTARGDLLEQIVFSEAPYLELKKIRTELGIRKSDLAKQLGVSRPFVHILEQGKRPNFSLKTLRKFIEALEALKKENQKILINE